MTVVDLPQAQRRISPLLGQRAWNVRRTIGSNVMIQLGRPQPPDRWGHLRGEYCLWISMAAWRLETAERVIIGSEDQGMQEALAQLEDRPLTDVLIRPPALATRFDFDGLRLETFPIYRPDPGRGDFDHWLLWLNREDVLVAGSQLTIEPARRRVTAEPDAAPAPAAPGAEARRGAGEGEGEGD